MPQKAKFSKIEIVNAAYKIAKKQGISCVSAREIAKVLGSSARPIFTTFDSMAEVISMLYSKVIKEFSKYMSSGNESYPAFKRSGFQMIKFACEEPKLFQMLFMYENKQMPSFSDFINFNDPLVKDDLKAITRDYGLSMANAKELFINMWVFTYGISSLAATKMCKFTDEEISELLSRNFAGCIVAYSGIDVNLNEIINNEKV